MNIALDLYLFPPAICFVSVLILTVIGNTILSFQEAYVYISNPESKMAANKAAVTDPVVHEINQAPLPALECVSRPIFNSITPLFFGCDSEERYSRKSCLACPHAKRWENFSRGRGNQNDNLLWDLQL